MAKRGPFSKHSNREKVAETREIYSFYAPQWRVFHVFVWTHFLINFRDLFSSSGWLLWGPESSDFLQGPVSLLQQELCDWNDLKQYKKSDCNKSIFARARIAGKLVLLGLRVTTNGFLSGSGVQQKARLRQKSDCNEKVRLQQKVAMQ